MVLGRKKKNWSYTKLLEDLTYNRSKHKQHWEDEVKNWRISLRERTKYLEEY